MSGGSQSNNRFVFNNQKASIQNKKKDSKKEQEYSLDNFWFNEWQFQSEGASQPIHLITKDGLIKEISSKIHSQKVRNLWDGIQIDNKNKWFGNRTIPYSSDKSIYPFKKIEKNSFLNIQEKIKNVILSLNYFQLLNLSKWFQDLPEKEKCEILDIFIDCQELKQQIIGSGSKKLIKDHLKINFEKFNKLALQNWEENFPKFSEVIGSSGVLYISKLKGFEQQVGSIIDKWIEEEMQRLKEGRKTKPPKMNGIYFLEKWLLREKFGDGCAKYRRESKDEQMVFGECLMENMDNFVEQSTKEWEKYLIPKVVDVVKAGTVIKNMPVFAPSKNYSKINLKKEKLFPNESINWSIFSSELQKKVHKSFKNNGYWKGVLDTSCSNITSEGLISLFVGLIAGDPIEKSGCYEFFNNLIFKAGEENKRLCLFEIPSINSYIQESQLLGIFNMSSWKKGNKFWGKCADFGL
ncbi:hypothetical protein [Mycoplasma parvum]|uniref:Uncharacterized protein n=1 Tax=Mycoplasma parvum str. Indiana TaxID=1403316 RepID=U5NBP3_9MOLU|nr:hypothetical protein [Mycoplasma parvum]AGX88976.1 hypothetical protein PRV_01060 [Mycoplasma parvum str. Indiana]